MTLLRHFSTLTLVAFGIAPLSADDLGGPILGFMAEPSGRAIRPIRGLPGSSTFGERIELEQQMARIAISTAHDCAVFWTDSGLRLGILRADAAPEFSPIPLPEGATPAVAAFSPSGANLLLVDDAARAAYVIPLREGKADAARRIDLSMLADPVARAAISDGDDPLVAGITQGERTSSFVADGSGNFRAIENFEQPSALAFIGDTTDLAIVDSSGRSVHRIRNPLAGSGPESLFSAEDLGGMPQIVSSADGRTLALLDGTRMVRTIDLRESTVASLECDCVPSTVQPLRGRSVFRLTDSMEQPVWIVDAGMAEPRLVFVPAPEARP